MDTNAIKGLAVVTIVGGEKLGQVEDVLLDEALHHVAGFQIESGGLLHRQHLVVPFQAVRSIGADALMVADANALQPAPGKQPAGQRAASQLDKLRVVTRSGEHAGNLTVAHFEPDTGAITSYELGTGMLHKNTLIGAASVISIGQDIMIVADDFATRKAGA
jgi:uncharacterized protein YrrD